MDTIKTIECDKGLKINIFQDENPENPRTEFDNETMMVCYHRRYTLGDKHDIPVQENRDKLEAIIKKQFKPVIIKALYMLDHSGITISTNSERFRACDPQGWDWGFIGYVFIPKNKVKEIIKIKRNEKITPEQMEQLDKALECEVDTYDRFLRGEAYCFSIENEDGEVLDSCGGFNDLAYCQEEAQKALEGELKALEDIPADSLTPDLFEVESEG